MFIFTLRNINPKEFVLVDTNKFVSTFGRQNTVAFVFTYVNTELFTFSNANAFIFRENHLANLFVLVFTNTNIPDTPNSPSWYLFVFE